MEQDTLRKLAAASAGLSLLGWFALRSKDTMASLDRSPHQPESTPDLLRIILHSPRTPGATMTIPAWTKRVLERVSRHEGTYWSQNLNRDKCGLSFGIIQWAQCVGNLGKLLTAMQQDDPISFVSTFGPAWNDLLAVTNDDAGEAARMHPVNGALLWHQPWTARFDTAGRNPIFQNTQIRLALQGPHWQDAMELSSILGVTTERGIAVLYDRTVQQPMRVLRGIANRTVKELEGQETSERQVIERFARNCALNFWRKPGPKPADWSSRLVFVEAKDGSWHVHSGSFDLYEDISRRNRNLLNDQNLTDAKVLEVPGQALV